MVQTNRRRSSHLNKPDESRKSRKETIMSIRDRIVGVVIAIVFGSFGVAVIKVGLKAGPRPDPQMSALFILIGVFFVIAFFGCLALSLMPERWWPKSLHNGTEQVK